jgi:predicted ATP-grasp superfamily ATP-dependent carboligase
MHGLIERRSGESKSRVSRLSSGRVAEPPPGAVVLGGDFNGLAVVRSLGRRGIPVCVIDDERSIARASRYATHAVDVPSLRDDAGVVAAVLGIGRLLGLDGWVLYPTRDEIVAALSRRRTILERRFVVSTPTWGRVRWAWDKRKTYQRAADSGIPVPLTWAPRDVGELAWLPISYPVAIKPAIKEHFIYHTKAKAWRADDLAQLEAKFEQARALVGEGEVMVQEYIPGDGRHQFAFCSFFKHGRSLGTMVVRRRRQHPAEFGKASTFVETVDVPELESMSIEFLRSIDFYGLAELEYKRDPRDGVFKLLDFNARCWGYNALGARAGVDFPALLFEDLAGHAPRERRAAVGVRWVRLVTDLPAAAVEIARGELSVRSYLRMLATSDIESVFSRDDPLPGLLELALVPYLVRKRGY